MMEESPIIYKLAFSFLKKINAEILREILSRGITPQDFFNLPTKELVNRLGLKRDNDFDKLAREEALFIARQEYQNLDKHKIRALFLGDEDYPQRLAETYDPPIILYQLGNCNLDSEHIISVVGTRKPTPYGVDFCDKLIEDLGGYLPDSIIISGLAYGIDATAHRKSLTKNLSTVAVVAHGLDMIYPAAHRNLAKEIIKSGGAIISEYPFGVKPFRPHFLARNRIVAALSDVTVVVESNIKGGAMSTANFAFMYNREVMALPGRITDSLSSGCNLLIRKNKAHLLECAADIIEVTGWKPLNLPVNVSQRNLFPELEGNAKRVYDLLKYKTEPVQFDQIGLELNLSPAILLSLLGEMEFDGIVIRYPGNRFSVS